MEIQPVRKLLILSFSAMQIGMELAKKKNKGDTAQEI